MILCQFVINVQGFSWDLAWKEPFFLFFILTSNLLCQLMRIRESIIKEIYYSLGIHKNKHYMIRGISITGKKSYFTRILSTLDWADFHPRQKEMISYRR